MRLKLHFQLTVSLQRATIRGEDAKIRALSGGQAWSCGATLMISDLESAWYSRTKRDERST
jgi:hypothetical protein